MSFNAFDFFDEANNQHVDVQDDHYKVVREIGAAGAVLLKNRDNTLPLIKPRNIVIVGDDSGPALRGPNGFSDRGGDDGILAMGWGSGTAQYPYLIDPLSAIQNRAIKDHTTVTWWRDNFDLAGAGGAVQGQEVAVSTIHKFYGREGATHTQIIDRFRKLRLWRRLHYRRRKRG